MLISASVTHHLLLIDSFIFLYIYYSFIPFRCFVINMRGRRLEPRCLRSKQKVCKLPDCFHFYSISPPARPSNISTNANIKVCKYSYCKNILFCSKRVKLGKTIMYDLSLFCAALPHSGFYSPMLFSFSYALHDIIVLKIKIMI